MFVFSDHLLSVLIWLPVIGGILVLGTGGDQNAALARKLALGFSLATLVLSFSLYSDFQLGTAEMQFVERASWIEAFKVEYFLGVDGFSVPLILLTTFLTVIVVVAGWQVIQERVAQYMAAFLFMEGFMVGVFSALDGILFYLFWELS